MSDRFIEYAGVPADRFALWEDILKDVGFARGYGPGHGRPGDEEHQRQAAQAIDLLWTHLAILPRHLDLNNRFVAAYLKSIEKTVDLARGEGAEKASSQSLSLSHLMSSLEALLLGLIGPEGQSPAAPHHLEIPNQPYTEAWLALASGSADLLPGPAAKRIVAWRTNRAVVLPAQAKEIAAGKPREAGLDECRALLEHWNRKSPVPRAADDAPVPFEDWQQRFRAVLAQMKLDLHRFAERGEIYVGWVAWYGYE
ncbi:MAG: hypothetical protein JO332_15755 [Planctomycetaceae bacterium]|nr:hypothetical protein [Planctomycetaceae bacterium]